MWKKHTHIPMYYGINYNVDNWASVCFCNDRAQFSFRTFLHHSFLIKYLQHKTHTHRIGDTVSTNLRKEFPGLKMSNYFGCVTPLGCSNGISASWNRTETKQEIRILFEKYHCSAITHLLNSKNPITIIISMPWNLPEKMVSKVIIWYL